MSHDFKVGDEVLLLKRDGEIASGSAGIVRATDSDQIWVHWLGSSYFDTRANWLWYRVDAPYHIESFIEKMVPDHTWDELELQ